MAEVQGDQNVAFWQERAEQLQGALESRVVIEQAKGVLRERLGVSLEAAFDVLRGAARTARTDIHGLAGQVVSSFATPEPVTQWIRRHPAVVVHGAGNGQPR